MVRTENSRDTGERGHCPFPFIRGTTGAEMPFHRSVIGNFMVYQDRLETFIAAIRTARNLRVVFYNLSVIIFEVNIVAEHKQALLITIFCFLKFSLRSSLFTAPLPCRCSVVLGKKCKIVRCGSLLCS